MLVNGGVDLVDEADLDRGAAHLQARRPLLPDAAEGGTAEGHSQVVLRSDSVRGPYVPYAGNPILTQRDLTAAGRSR